MYCSKLQELHESGALNSPLCKKQVSEVELDLNKVNECNKIMNLSMDKTELGIRDEQCFNAELDDQAEYNVNIPINLDEYEDYLVQKREESVARTAKDVHEFMSDGKHPILTCGSFNGREKDKFAFRNFLNQFNNVIGSRKHLSESAKMSYLVGYLKGYALKQVSHLSITDENYSVALNLLNDKFLDKEFIIDETLKNILKAMPSKDYDPEFTNVKYFISEVRSY